MPRHYKAITDHASVDYHVHLNRIDVYFNWKHDELVALFKRWGFPPLEADDSEALIAALKRRASGFALECNAVPLRTPLQLMPTVRAIARRPRAFLDRVGDYDPRASAMVYGAFVGLSSDNRMLLARYEAGTGPEPPAEGIAEAANKVLCHLETKIQRNSRVGGQTLVLQRKLVRDLARIFLNFGGFISRVTRFDPESRPQYVETGPFHDFLEIVLPPAQPFAKRAGFQMKSIRSMVLTYLKSQKKTPS